MWRKIFASAGVCRCVILSNRDFAYREVDIVLANQPAIFVYTHITAYYYMHAIL